MKFSAVLLFAVIWFTFAYIPMAHMVWYWAGPDAHTRMPPPPKQTVPPPGYLFQHGALDFAGGTVVHINAAVAGLVGAFMGGQTGWLAVVTHDPHSLTMTMTVPPCSGSAGSASTPAPPGSQRHGGPGLRQHLDRTGRCRPLLDLRRVGDEGRPLPAGRRPGAVAGLVAITPAAGFVGVGAPSSSAC